MARKTANEQFKAAMERNGLTVQLYQGRWFWKGYGVSIDRYDLEEVKRMTKVALQYESLGLGYIVYPVQSMSDEEWEIAKEQFKNKKELDDE